MFRPPTAITVEYSTLPGDDGWLPKHVAEITATCFSSHPPSPGRIAQSLVMAGGCWNM